ncbi:hypothetical protein BpHYR1_033334 [Brachionus plicatilis]|uniref:Uncharacterized protein n=1 Tax=Brachionus plicatilis TaxID=10195 RepID=A0A3M7PTF3_BRAPC|nr:hypothetical protein BpHYR1_033334 [Brachionus plicatilis]
MWPWRSASFHCGFYRLQLFNVPLRVRVNVIWDAAQSGQSLDGCSHEQASIVFIWALMTLLDRSKTSSTAMRKSNP